MSEEQNDERLKAMAMYFTGNDSAKAAEMIAGRYKDCYAIKGSFSSTVIYGAFLTFYNSRNTSFSSIYIAVSPSFSFGEIKPAMNWLNFEREIAALRAQGSNDESRSSSAADAINAAMNSSFCQEVGKYFVSDDYVTINLRFKKMLEDRLETKNLKCTIEFEPVSSLEIQMKSKSTAKVDFDSLFERRQSDIDSVKKIGVASARPDDPLAGKTVRALFRGTLILSPINGTLISKLKEGDRVKAVIVDSNPKAEELAKAFGCYDSEKKQMTPMSGRIIAIKNNAKKGYSIYIAVAQGVFIKAIEEDNVRVALDDDEIEIKSDSGKKQRKFSPSALAGMIAGLVIAVMGFILLYLSVN